MAEFVAHLPDLRHHYECESPRRFSVKVDSSLGTGGPGLSVLSPSPTSTLHQAPSPKASANVEERSETDVDVEAKPIPFSDGCLHLLRHLRSRDLCDIQ